MSFPVRKALKGRRAVVIGSGPGGLAAAISLAVRGARVVILDKMQEIGGPLRTLRLGDYAFDQWPPHLTRPDVLAELFASAGHRLTDFLTLERPDSLCRFHLPDGRKVDFYHDLNRFAEEIARLDPEDARRLKGFFQKTRGMATAMEHFQRQRPFTPARLGLSWSTWSALPLLLDPRKDGRLVLHSFRNPHVRDIMLSMRGLLDRSPFAGRRLYMHRLGEFQETGGWQVVGGMEQLLQALLRLCEILGVRMARRAEVQHIELKDGRVRSVSGRGFKPLTASIVVSNIDVNETLRNLLPREGKRVELERLEKLPPPHSRFILLVGAKKVWPEVAPLNFFVSQDVREESRFLDRWKLPATSGTILLQSKAMAGGRSALCARIEMPAPSSRYLWSENHAEEERQRIVAALQDRGLTDLEEHAELQEYASPLVASRKELLNFSTVAGHGMKNLRGLMRLPPGRVADAHGLYLSGPGSHPGRGLSEEMLSGIITGVSAADDAG